MVYIQPIYQSLDKRIWFTISFFHVQGSCTLFQVLSFLLNYDLFCPSWRYEEVGLPPDLANLENLEKTLNFEMDLEDLENLEN